MDWIVMVTIFEADDSHTFPPRVDTLNLRYCVVAIKVRGSYEMLVAPAIVVQGPPLVKLSHR